MNEDYKPEYEASLRDLINTRADLDSLLSDAQTVTEDNASFVITESESLHNLEEDARQRWIAARDAYLS